MKTIIASTVAVLCLCMVFSSPAVATDCTQACDCMDCCTTEYSSAYSLVPTLQSNGVGPFSGASNCYTDCFYQAWIIGVGCYFMGGELNACFLAAVTWYYVCIIPCKTECEGTCS
jgi:hypothetical protein